MQFTKNINQRSPIQSIERFAFNSWSIKITLCAYDFDIRICERGYDGDMNDAGWYFFGKDNDATPK